MTDELLVATFGLFAIALGLPIGSFLNVLIARLPEDRSLLPPSACPRCGTRIRWFDLVPVASWLILRGRCRACHGKIAPTYPLVELLTAMLAWLLFQRLVQTPDDLDVGHLVAWVGYFTFLCLLIVASYVDLRHLIIPDQTSIYAAPAGIVLTVVLALLGYDGPLAISWQSSLIGALAGGGFLAAIAIVGMFVFRREALGWGDVKLVAMIGAFVGPVPGLWVVLFIGAAVGSLVGLVHMVVTRQRSYLPWGPSLAFAGAAYLLYGDVLIEALIPGAGDFVDFIGL